MYYMETNVCHNPIVCVYAKNYQFDNLLHWNTHHNGKEIEEFLRSSEYSHHMKGIFFDGIAMKNLPTSLMNVTNNLECVMNWMGYMEGNRKHIHLFSTCLWCSRICTIDSEIDYIPILNVYSNLCHQCSDQY